MREKTTHQSVIIAQENFEDIEHYLALLAKLFIVINKQGEYGTST